MKSVVDFKALFNLCADISPFNPYIFCTFQSCLLCAARRKPKSCYFQAYGQHCFEYMNSINFVVLENYAHTHSISLKAKLTYRIRMREQRSCWALHWSNEFPYNSRNWRCCQLIVSILIPIHSIPSDWKQFPYDSRATGTAVGIGYSVCCCCFHAHQSQMCFC